MARTPFAADPGGRTAPVPSYLDIVDLSTREKIAEFERTPLSQRGLSSNVYDHIRAGATIDPEATAFVYLPDAHRPDLAERLTHGAVLQRITQAANLFHELGVRAGDPVSILTANTPEPQFALWGAQTTGIANPLNWMLEPQLLGELITAAGSKVLVSYGGDDVTDPWPKIEQILAHAPAVQIVIRAGGYTRGAVPRGVRLLELIDELDRQPGDRLVHPRAIGRDDVGILIGTGGTTGAPKLARVTHGGQIYASWASAVSHQVPVGAVRLCASPMFHIHGIVTTQLTCLAVGGTAVFPSSGGWRGPGVIDNFWSITQRFSVTSVPLLPTIANRLIRRPEAIPPQHTITRVSCGSAPLAKEVADRFAQLTGVPIAEGYGLTETCSGVVTVPAGSDPPPGTVGMPVAYTQAKVVRQRETGEYIDCGPSEPGILLLRGPAVTPGYQDARQNTGVLLDDGWLNTGDLASIDEDGWVRITGRAKDLIIRGGHNIDPAPVEEALYSYPRITDAAVVGMPDPDTGELPVAYVVAADGADIDLADLADHLHRQVRERAAVPKDFFIVDELPKSAVGKILKNRLRVDAAERCMTRLLDTAGLQGRYTLSAADHGAAGIEVDVRLHEQDPSILQLARTALGALTIRHRISAADQPHQSEKR